MNQLEAMQLPFNQCSKCGGSPTVTVNSNQSTGVTSVQITCTCGNRLTTTFGVGDEDGKVHPIIALQERWNAENRSERWERSWSNTSIALSAAAIASYQAMDHSLRALVNHVTGLDKPVTPEVRSCLRWFFESGSDDLQTLAQNLIKIIRSQE
jgi:hypothetical protein